MVLRDLLGHLAEMGGMVSVVPLVPPEHQELMEETVIWVCLEIMEEMVRLVLVEQMEGTEETVLWALQVLHQDWTRKEFVTL